MKTQRKLYLLGWVVGVKLVCGGEDLDSKKYLDNRNMWQYKTIIRTEDEAKKVAEDLAKKHPTSKWFYREYIYETSNPDHAQGLPEHSGNIKIIYVN